MELQRTFNDDELKTLLNQAISQDTCCELYNSLNDLDQDMFVLIGLTSGDIHIANKVMILNSQRLREQINNPLIDMYRLVIRYSDNLTLLICISQMNDTTIERIYSKMLDSARLSQIPYRVETLKLFLHQRKGKE